MSAITPTDGFWTACCGMCCIACTGALDSWCFTKSYGSGGGGRQAGCCGSCCNKSFDEDDFQAKNEAGANDAANKQPAPHEDMQMTDKPSEAAESPANP